MRGAVTSIRNTYGPSFDRGSAPRRAEPCRSETMQNNKKSTAPAVTAPQATANQATLSFTFASEAGLGVGRGTKQTTFGEVRCGQFSVRLAEAYALGILARMMRIEQLDVLVGADTRARLDIGEQAPSTGHLRAQGFNANEVEFIEAFAAGLKRPTSIAA